MTASDRVPDSCKVKIAGEECIRIGGEDWSPIIVRSADFDTRFNDIADAPDFLAAMEIHPAAQTPGWQAAVQYLRNHA